MNERCMHVRLAQGAAAEVDYCNHCGIFHVNLESVTVRFRPTALRDVRDTLSAALAAYEDAVKAADAAVAAASPTPRRPQDDLH